MLNPKYHPLQLFFIADHMWKWIGSFATPKLGIVTLNAEGWDFCRSEITVPGDHELSNQVLRLKTSGIYTDSTNRLLKIGREYWEWPLHMSDGGAVS